MKLLLPIALTLLASCTTYYDVRFAPAPLETRVGDNGDAARVGRALVTVMGVRKPDSTTGEPARVEMRMRLENLGTEALVVEPDSFELIAANLQSFDRGQVMPVPEGALANGAVCEFDLRFPLLPGKSIHDYDLSGLNVKWAVRFGDVRVITGASFVLVPPPAYYGYYADPWGWGYYPHCSVAVGVGVGTFCEDRH